MPAAAFATGLLLRDKSLSRRPCSAIILCPRHKMLRTQGPRSRWLSSSCVAHSTNKKTNLVVGFFIWRPVRVRTRTKTPPIQHLDTIDFFSISPLKNTSLLAEKYLKNSLSTTQIASELGVSRSAVKERLREIGVLNGRASRHSYLTGQTPFGWKKERGKLVPHLGEQRVLQEIKELRASAKSLRSIAQILNSKSIKSKNGETWHAETVRRALQNERNQGENHAGIAKRTHPNNRSRRSSGTGNRPS